MNLTELKNPLLRRSDNLRDPAVLPVKGGYWVYYTRSHAENGAIIDYLENQFIDAGRETPEHYVATHPNLSEAEAIFRLLTLASVTHCPIYIPHISALESLDVVKWFKNRSDTEISLMKYPSMNQELIPLGYTLRRSTMELR